MDDAGIEGFPFRLLIVSVVVALTAPAVFGGLSAYDRAQVDARVRASVDRVVVAARQFYAAGGGGDRIDLDLRGGPTARVEYVLFGDVLGGPLAATVRYKLTDAPEFLYATDVPMTSDGDGPLRLGPGVHVVFLEVVPAPDPAASVVVLRVGS
jgi:hypothetical protein